MRRVYLVIRYWFAAFSGSVNLWLVLDIKFVWISTAYHTTRYSSVVTTASTENAGSSPPPILLTVETPTPAKLPCPLKVTSTGKKAPASSPPTVNIREPERVSSNAVTKGIDQAREWDDGSRAHSPEWDETVGYEPALKVRSGLVSQKTVKKPVYLTGEE